MEKKSFIVAMKQFFGMKDGQDLKSFKAEIDALTQKDRDDLVLMFAQIGIEVDPASKVA